MDASTLGVGEWTFEHQYKTPMFLFPFSYVTCGNSLLWHNINVRFFGQEILQVDMGTGNYFKNRRK
jgi:hypothetical protein